MPQNRYSATTHRQELYSTIDNGNGTRALSFFLHEARATEPYQFTANASNSKAGRRRGIRKSLSVHEISIEGPADSRSSVLQRRQVVKDGWVSRGQITAPALGL